MFSDAISVEDALLQRDTRVLIGMQEFSDTTRYPASLRSLATAPLRRCSAKSSYARRRMGASFDSMTSFLSFGFEPEITAKVSPIKGVRVYEVPISYCGRGYAEGKKANWRDGFSALRCILKYNLRASTSRVDDTHDRK
jgi:hypothetical protein